MMRREHLIVIVLLLLGLAARIGLTSIFPGGLSNDAKSYYRSAINVVEGNGYSERESAPFYPFFFREPLTTYSIAATMYMVKQIKGIEHLDYPTVWELNEMTSIDQTIVFYVRFVSDILQLVALFLLYCTLRQYASVRFSLIFLGIAMVYYPLVFYCSLLLREVYVFFLLALITWLWERYIRIGSRKYFFLTAISVGITLQYLHLYWLILFFFVAAIWYCRKQYSFFKRLVLIFLFAITMFLPSVPWVLHVYNYYPDIRVAKTLGAALNAEYTNNLNAYRALGYDPYEVRQGDIPGEVEVKTWIFLPADPALIFDFTFDGTYSREAARLNSYNTTSGLISYYAGRVVEAFHNNVFIVGITYDYGLFYGHFTTKDFLKFLFCLPFILMGLLALFGVWPIFKRYWFLMPAFCYHALFFIPYGDEERRVYMLVPYIIMFALCFITSLLKNNNKILCEE